jgi:hypothetical protein
MQATIFGAACIEKARTLKGEKEKSMEIWNDNDLEFQLGLENFSANEAHGVAQSQCVLNPRRLFHTWREEIGKRSLRKHRMWSMRPSCFVSTRGCVGLIPIQNACMWRIERTWSGTVVWGGVSLEFMRMVLNVEFVHLSKEEKAAQKTAREAEARKGGKGRKGAGKRKCDDFLDEDNSDSDREYL